MTHSSDNRELHVLQEGDFNPETSQWNNKQLKRMIWQSRWKMLLNAGGSIILIYLLYNIYVSALHIYFDQSEVRNDFMRSMTTVVEMHGDGLRIDQTYHEPFEVTNYLSQKANLKLYRHVGSWKAITGEIQAELSLSGKFTYTITDTGAYLDGSKPGPFYLPYALVYDKPVEVGAEENNSVIRLNKMDDGHVAEMSFSVKQLISPDQLLELLSGYDVGVTAMPIFSGELTEFHA